MTLTRTQITFTNDASRPRVLHLGNGVIWYVYLRAGDRGLYLQREANNVRGAEVLVVAPADRVEAVVDPDGARAWIYFTCDGALRAIEVTTLAETPSTQFFQRSPGWHERVKAGPSSGAGVVSAFGFTDEHTGAWRTDDGPVELYPPEILILDADSPTHLLLHITRGSVTYGTVDKFRVFRMSDHDGAGWSWYSDVPLLRGATTAALLIPRGVPPTVTRWVAVAVRYTPHEESAWSDIVSDSDSGDAVVGRNSGPGVASTWALTQKDPLKLALAPDPYEAGANSGPGTASTWALTAINPIKLLVPLDPYTEGSRGGQGILGSWALNGIGVITP